MEADGCLKVEIVDKQVDDKSGLSNDVENDIPQSNSAFAHDDKSENEKEHINETNNEINLGVDTENQEDLENSEIEQEGKPTQIETNQPQIEINQEQVEENKQQSDNMQSEKALSVPEKDEKLEVDVDKPNIDKPIVDNGIDEDKEVNKENVKQKEPNNNTPSRSILSSIAKFESPANSKLQSPTPKKEKGMFRVVQTEKCAACQKTVYAMEKLEMSSHIYHKNCFKCSHCSARLTPKSFSMNEGVIYCTNHFKQLFARKGNYDEGFGRQQYKKKWGDDKSKTDDSTATA